MERPSDRAVAEAFEHGFCAADGPCQCGFAIGDKGAETNCLPCQDRSHLATLRAHLAAQKAEIAEAWEVLDLKFENTNSIGFVISALIGDRDALLVSEANLKADVERLQEPRTFDHGTVGAMLAENVKLHQLLKIAACPDEACKDGAVPRGPDPDGNWVADQCRFCYEREALDK